jgi:hypothetical protein
VLITVGIPATELVQAVQEERTFWRPEALASQGYEVLIELFENPLLIIRRIDGLTPLENWKFNGQIGENILFERSSRPEWADFEGVVIDSTMFDQLSYEGINTYIDAQL